MNDVIKRELDKIRAPLPPYDDTTLEIHIAKKEELVQPKFEKTKSYIVKLADYILNEPPNFTLSANWNKGVIPTSEHLVIYIKEVAGKMLRVCARGYDANSNIYLEESYQDLWLPSAGVDIIYEI